MLERPVLEYIYAFYIRTHFSGVLVLKCFYHQFATVAKINIERLIASFEFQKM